MRLGAIHHFYLRSFVSMDNDGLPRGVPIFGILKPMHAESRKISFDMDGRSPMSDDFIAFLTGDGLRRILNFPMNPKIAQKIHTLLGFSLEKKLKNLVLFRAGFVV